MATNTKRNAYEILDVSPNSSIEEVKSRYHELAKKYHPDKQANKSRDEAEKAAKIYEDLEGTIKDQDKDGIDVSFDFFDSIRIPASLMQDNTTFDEKMQEWVWSFKMAVELYFSGHREMFTVQRPSWYKYCGKV